MYAGCQDGYVKVWDLETRTLVRSIIVVEVSISSSRLRKCEVDIPVECRCPGAVYVSFRPIHLLCQRTSSGEPHLDPTYNASHASPEW